MINMNIIKNTLKQMMKIGTKNYDNIIYYTIINLKS